MATTKQDPVIDVVMESEAQLKLERTLLKAKGIAATLSVSSEIQDSEAQCAMAIADLMEEAEKLRIQILRSSHPYMPKVSIEDRIAASKSIQARQ